MKLRDLSEATGLPLSTIFRLDHHESVRILRQDAAAIAEVLDVPVDQLFEDPD